MGTDEPGDPCTAEDIGSVSLSLFALLRPILVIFAIGGVVVGFVLLFRQANRRRRERRQNLAL